MARPRAGESVGTGTLPTTTQVTDTAAHLQDGSPAHRLTAKTTKVERALEQYRTLNIQMTDRSGREFRLPSPGLTAPAPPLLGELGAVSRKQANFLIAQQTSFLQPAKYAALPTKEMQAAY